MSKKDKTLAALAVLTLILAGLAVPTLIRVMPAEWRVNMVCLGLNALVVCMALTLILVDKYRDR